MNTRKDVRVPGIPFKWITNLTDEEVREFHALYGDQIAQVPAQDHHADNQTTKITIQIRCAFFPFREGVCLWSAFEETHTVLYRTNRDWELWNARQNEIEELRQEQATEEAVEKKLVMTEETHLRDKTDSAMKSGDYDAAAAFVTARAQLRDTFKHFRSMPAEWTVWSPVFIFAQFPTSRQGIEFFRRFHPLPQFFSNFAHWYSVRCGLKGTALLDQTRMIYEEGMKMFPDSAQLAQAASLFFRRVGERNLAMAVCLDAIKRGLRDGTKSGFEGRLKRLERESHNVRLRRGSGAN